VNINNIQSVSDAEKYAQQYDINVVNLVGTIYVYRKNTNQRVEFEQQKFASDFKHPKISKIEFDDEKIPRNAQIYFKNDYKMVSLCGKSMIIREDNIVKAYKSFVNIKNIFKDVIDESNEWEWEFNVNSIITKDKINYELDLYNGIDTLRNMYKNKAYVDYTPNIGYANINFDDNSNYLSVYNTGTLVLKGSKSYEDAQYHLNTFKNNV